jgi:predicted lipid-binding transport protein (Tim44 family)
MSKTVDSITILFMVLTVYVAWRLRSVLGQRTGTERPPKDVTKLMSRLSSPVKPENPTKDTAVSEEQNKTYVLPTALTPQAVPMKEKPFPWKDIAEPNSPLAQGLDKIAHYEPNFDAAHFLEGAKIAYEMVINAFSAGDRETLKTLLTPSIYREFDAQLTAREQKNVTVSTTFVALEKAEIVKANAGQQGVLSPENPPKGYVTIHFLAQLLTSTKTADGTIVEGSVEEPVYVDDIWTFTRPLGGGEVNWALSETRSAQDAPPPAA